MQSGTSFAVSSPFFKSRRREKCFDLGTNRHRESLWCESFRRSPLATLQRVFLARVPFIVLYILSLPSPFCQFSPPLIFRPFSAPTLLRADPSPRRPFSTLPLLRAAPSPRRPFSASTLLRAVPRSAFAPFSPSAPSVRFVFKRNNRAIRAQTPLQNCHLRFTNRTPKPLQSPSKAEKRIFSQIF